MLSRVEHENKYYNIEACFSSDKTPALCMF